MAQRTLAIIKPDAVEKGGAGEITTRIERAGFTIVGAKMIHMSSEQAGGFYIVHKERPFYGSLCAFMTQGPVMVIALEGDNAIARWRELMGATDPAKAAPRDDPQGLRLVHRGQRRAWLRLARVRGLRDPVLLQRAGALLAVTFRGSPRRILFDSAERSARWAVTARLGGVD